MKNQKEFVFHGSPKKFDSKEDVPEAIPRPNVRTIWDENTGSDKIIFNQDSFHATPHKWIALAYTYNPAPFEIDGRVARYNMGVSLYEDTHEVEIYGFNSLEESLKVLYGEGGYLYHFDRDEFLYKEGLGPLEVIVEKPTKPITVEKIEDPVAEMKKLGVTFKFIDLALPENEEYRNYYKAD